MCASERICSQQRSGMTAICLIVEESYFDTDGRPAPFGYFSGERCSRWSAQYDRFGKLIRSACVSPVARETARPTGSEQTPRYYC